MLPNLCVADLVVEEPARHAERATSLQARFSVARRAAEATARPEE